MAILFNTLSSSLLNSSTWPASFSLCRVKSFSFRVLLRSSVSTISLKLDKLCVCSLIKSWTLESSYVFKPFSMSRRLPPSARRSLVCPWSCWSSEILSARESSWCCTPLVPWSAVLMLGSIAWRACWTCSSMKSASSSLNSPRHSQMIALIPSSLRPEFACLPLALSGPGRLGRPRYKCLEACVELLWDEADAWCRWPSHRRDWRLGPWARLSIPSSYSLL